MFRLITHIVLAIVALIAVPGLVDVFAANHQHLAEPVTALAVALALIPAIKPMFE